MFSNFLKALKAALQKLSALISWFFSLFFGGSPAVPVLMAAPLIEDLQEAVAEVEKDQGNRRRIARQISAWCGDALIVGGPVPMPQDVPRFVQVWLPGLTRTECEIIFSCDLPAIIAHAFAGKLIPSVRRVQVLEPAGPWPPLVHHEIGHDAIINDEDAIDGYAGPSSP